MWTLTSCLLYKPCHCTPSISFMEQQPNSVWLWGRGYIPAISQLIENSSWQPPEGMGNWDEVKIWLRRSESKWCLEVCISELLRGLGSSKHQTHTADWRQCNSPRICMQPPGGTAIHATQKPTPACGGFSPFNLQRHQRGFLYLFLKTCSKALTEKYGKQLRRVLAQIWWIYP